MQERITCDGRYIITSEGDVYSLFYKNRNSFSKRGAPIKMKPSMTNGYLRVTLANKKQWLVHRLVAKTFIKGFKNEHQVNHIDGDKINNRLSNLEISNNSHNQLHSIHVLGNITNKKLTTKDLDKIVNLWASGVGVTKISRITGTSYSCIYALLKNRLLMPKSTIYKNHYAKVLAGFAKSRHSKHRHAARAALAKITGGSE